MLYASKIMMASKAWADKQCYYCGKYFKAGESIILIVPTCEVKKKYDRLSLNAIMHLDEYNALKENMTDDELIDHLGKHTKRKEKLELTSEQTKNMQAFKDACWEYGFRIETDALQREHLIKQRKNGSSISIQYNPLTDKIGIRTKIRNTGMFDRLFEADLAAKIYNKMHEILGDGKKDDFTAEGVFNKAIDETNKIMGK